MSDAVMVIVILSEKNFYLPCFVLGMERSTKAVESVILILSSALKGQWCAVVW